MDVYEFCSLAIEDSEDVCIFCFGAGERVFTGNYEKARHSVYRNEEVLSFGIEDGIICINIG